MSHESLATATSVVMNGNFWIATFIFALTFVFIVIERVHNTVAALAGASLMLVVKIIDQREAFHFEELGVDWNVIFLLISMMIIVNVLRPTGFFEYAAIKSAKLGDGHPLRVMILFVVTTAVLSAFLNNVTTVLIIAPVSLYIAKACKVDARMLLIAEAIASNIGGTATLIGDPPNMMIASKAGLSFMDFIYNLTPIVLLLMVVLVLLIWWNYGKKPLAGKALEGTVSGMDEKAAIKDPAMLKKSLIVLGLVIAGFVFNDALHYEPATIALFGAVVLLLLAGAEDPAHVLTEVEWNSVFFFIGMYIIVGAVVKVGLISWMSSKLMVLTNGNLFATSMVLLWFSALASAFIGSIPCAAALNLVVLDMAKHFWPGLTGIELVQKHELLPVWWSFALGACLGGNFTSISAPANVVIVELAAKAKEEISFQRFAAYSAPITFLTLIISSIYVYIRYYF